MGFENRVFDVSGELDEKGLAHFKTALDLSLALDGINRRFVAWAYSSIDGLLLTWVQGQSGFAPLPCSMDAEEAYGMAVAWLDSVDARNVKSADAVDRDHADGEVENGPAWRIMLCKKYHRTISIRRVSAWYGK